MQKFREQIKIWQLNDVIKTLSLSSSSLANKLNDNKKLIEEAMEVYKDVERTSKLKTFSNQSILMSAMESYNDQDDDDDQSSDVDFSFASSEEEEEEDYNDMTPEAVEAVKYLKGVIGQIASQTKKLNNEFEKLANKKLRKNNLSTIESKKEKIQSTVELNKFHTKKLFKVIKYVRANKMSDMNLIWLIKDDLNNYLENNGNIDFTDDTSIYDDIFNLVVIEDDYSEFNDSEIHSNTSRDPEEVPIKNGSANNNVLGRLSSGTVETRTQPNHINTSIPASPVNKHMSPELASPAIVRTLKPASTPSKPVGNLKWSTAAAGILEVSEESHYESSRASAASSVSPKVTNGSTTVAPLSTVKSSSSRVETKFVHVLENSSLPQSELNLFSDLNLVKLPPGMQDLIISFTSKRNNPEDFKLLCSTRSYNQYVTPIKKCNFPELDAAGNVGGNNNNKQFKPPVQLFKLLSYWNRIRANDEFDRILEEIQTLSEKDSGEGNPIANELTLVLFYGFYFGFTPVENLIAESCLFKLGWRPYNTNHSDSSQLNQSQNQISSPSSNGKVSQSSKDKVTVHSWVRRIKLLSNSEESTAFEIGDYQVFDLSFWEVYIKYGFTLDLSLCKTEPTSAIC